jgi:hypothetical protein
MTDNENDDIQALSARLKDGPLTVWATLQEDNYETFFGDGYYAYVDKVFLTPTAAARAIEATQDHPMIKWHIRRYDLIGSGENIRIRPAPTEQEPTTIEVIAKKLRTSEYSR